MCEDSFDTTGKATNIFYLHFLLFFPSFFFYFDVRNVLIEPGVFNMLMGRFTRRCLYLTDSILKTEFGKYDSNNHFFELGIVHVEY